MTEETEDWLYELYSERGKRRLILQNIITSCKCYVLSVVNNFLNHLHKRSAQRTARGPPSPRSRLVKNVTDTKLVNYLAKYRRFSIGSLRKIADGLYYFY